MARINVSTPRTALLLLILIVGCGLILSLIRMSEMPTTAYHTSTRQHIAHVLDQAEAELNTDPLRAEDGPTRFQDDSIIKMYQEDESRGEHHRPEVSESTAQPGSEQATEQSTEPPPTEEQSTEPPPTEEQSTEPPPTEEQSTEPPPTEEENSEQSVEPSSEQTTEEGNSEVPQSEEESSEQYVEEQSSEQPTEQGTEQEAEEQMTVEAGSSSIPSSSPEPSSSEAPSSYGVEDKPTEPLTLGIEDETETNTKSSRPVHVLLLTEGRSGSTWLSSYFWHRDEAYYTFEPLYQTGSWKRNGCSGTEERKKECEVEILSKFWKCDFHSSDLSVLGRYPTYHLDCKPHEERCSVQGKENMCNATTHRVAKTIRLWDLTHIEEIVKDTAHYDVRVIHLVRDPRPLLKSRSKPGFGSLDGTHKAKDFSEESFEEQCATVCKRMLETSQLGDNPPDWLKNRYVRISHEQMSLHPVETAKMLYKFTDLSWTAETEEYIYKTATGGIGKGGMFGIAKISTKVINQWKMMKEEQITKITNTCFETIKYLGYETDLEKIRQWKLDNVELFTDDELVDLDDNSKLR